jgi:succinyl-CoA synthetase beta subunit
MADNIVLEMDDAALYRQERFLEPYPALDFNPQVREAQQLGLVYKPVDPCGEVGIIASGMGLVLASVDYVIQAGMSVQGCVILGGGLSEERMASSIRMMLKIQKVEGLLVNLFGGVNSCEIMAKGIITGLEDSQRSPVMIIKMTGHDQEEGWRILEESGSVLVKSPSSEQAVAHLVRLMQKERKFSI